MTNEPSNRPQPGRAEFWTFSILSMISLVVGSICLAVLGFELAEGQLSFIGVFVGIVLLVVVVGLSELYIHFGYIDLRGLQDYHLLSTSLIVLLLCGGSLILLSSPFGAESVVSLSPSLRRSIDVYTAMGVLLSLAGLYLGLRAKSVEPEEPG